MDWICNQLVRLFCEADVAPIASRYQLSQK